MAKGLYVFLMCVAAFPLVGQKSSDDYQVGTIVKVRPHPNTPEDQNTSASLYEISIKVADTKYDILYTQPSGSVGVEFAEGLQKLVLIGTGTLTFNDILGKSTAAPILRRESLPPQPALDWSKAPGNYFSMKLRNLSEQLNLSSDQILKIKRILSQEAGEAGQVIGNPVLSRKDQFDKVRKIVQLSDKKLKPWLSAEQWSRLEAMRKEQRRELEEYVANKEKTTNPGN
jgi:Spy/CpxP family protein refolding chaperone